MVGESEKDRYKNLLDLEKAKRAQRQKKKQAASSSRPTAQQTPPRPQDQPPQQQQQQQQPSSAHQQPALPQSTRPAAAPDHVIRGNWAHPPDLRRSPAHQYRWVRSATDHLSRWARLRGKVVSIISDLRWIRWRQLSRLDAGLSFTVRHSSITLHTWSPRPPLYVSISLFPVIAFCLNCHF